MKAFVIALVVAVAAFAVGAVTYTAFASGVDGMNIIQVSPDCVEILNGAPVAAGTYCQNG